MQSLTHTRRSNARRFGFALSLLVLFYCGSAGNVFATHFRYGHLSWRARTDLGTFVAEFSLFNSFRRDGYLGTGPDGRPVTGDIITEFIGDTTLNFGDGSTLGTLDYVVVAFDPAANWIYCKALANRNNVGLPIVHTYSGAGPWVADINSCCRISNSVNAPDGSYRVLTTVNFNAENSSAVSILPTIVNCQSGSVCSFSVPAADSDGDTLRYRLSNGSEDGFITQPAGLSIDSNTGQISWTTAGRQLGLWSCQVTIEARNPSTLALKSQVAVDFLINLSTAVPGTPPVFDQTGNNLNCGHTFDHVAGRLLTFTVSATDNDISDTVTLNAIGLPIGATMTPGLPISGHSVSSTFNWTPTTVQGGSHIIVFTATDNTGLQTQCSAIIDVKVDSDGDGLPDDWEINGYTYNGQFINLPAMGADPNHKDILVEVDYMTGHRPDQSAIDMVRDSFARVPNSLFAIPNPDGTDGITLHVNIDEELPHIDQLGTNSAGGYNWTEFDVIKHGHFNEALSLSHHYCLFIHNGPLTNGNPNSGIARDIPSSDFIVSLGSWPTGNFLGIPIGEGGTASDQAGTFMHELGHNLNLRHGGFENRLYKPNYLSIMNYSFQLSGLRFNGSNGLFDYSRFTLPPLLEFHLDERIGLNGGAAINGYGTRWYCPRDSLGSPSGTTNNANGAINWNCNKRLIFFDNIEPDVATDINDDGSLTPLFSYNDWASLNFKGGLIGAGAVFPLPPNTPNDEIDVQTASLIPPFAPSSLSVAFDACALRINWVAVGPIGDYTYRVYRSTGGQPFALVGTTNLTSLSDPGLNLAITYSYYVTSVNAFGTESAASDTVTFKGGIDLTTNVVARVSSFHLEQGLEDSLVAKLNGAKQSLVRGESIAGCNVMQAFINELNAQSGKKLTLAQANQLKAEAMNIRSIICCP